MVVSVYRKPGMSWDEFTQRWRVVHGDLVRSYAKTLRFKKYVQSHFQPSADVEAFAKIRGWLPPPEGLAEIWWESAEEMQAAFATPEGQAASVDLARDESEFVDHTRISAFLSKEFVVFDYS
jgi:uncharacterized protein (TIGR02118 family)